MMKRKSVDKDPVVQKHTDKYVTSSSGGSGNRAISVTIYHMDTPPYDPISWDDATGIGWDLRAYECYDDKGQKLTIGRKIAAHHQSYHPLQTHPALFYNLRLVTSDPHNIVVNPPSSNPVSIQNRQLGDIIVYSRSGLIKDIDFPDYPEVISDEVSVTVLYNQQTGENYSLTYDIRTEHA